MHAYKELESVMMLFYLIVLPKVFLIFHNAVQCEITTEIAYFGVDGLVK